MLDIRRCGQKLGHPIAGKLAVCAGVVRRWEGPVGELRNGTFTALPSSQPRYVVKGGMRQLAEYLAAKAASALRQQLGNASSSSSAARINGSYSCAEE